jgi:hypothetical protein
MAEKLRLVKNLVWRALKREAEGTRRANSPNKSEYFETTGAEAVGGRRPQQVSTQIESGMAGRSGWPVPPPKRIAPKNNTTSIKKLLDLV